MRRSSNQFSLASLLGALTLIRHAGVFTIRRLEADSARISSSACNCIGHELADISEHLELDEQRKTNNECARR